MIELTFDEGKFTGADCWEEITLDQFIRVCEVEIPTRLRNLLIAATALNDEDIKLKQHAEDNYDKLAAEITTRDLIQTFPLYYGELMSILTDVPREIIERIDGTLRAEFFDRYIRYVVLSIFYTQPIKYTANGMVPYVPDKPITEFDLNGTTYYLPKTLKLYDNDIFLADEPVVSFAEASEIEMTYRDLLEKGVSKLPMFMAIYCRPKDEQYDERKVLRREPLMRSVTMDKVWSVFFCISQLLRCCNHSIPLFTKKAVHLVREM